MVGNEVWGIDGSILVLGLEGAVDSWFGLLFWFGFGLGLRGSEETHLRQRMKLKRVGDEDRGEEAS